MLRRITVQYLRSCPNATLALERLGAALRQLDGPPPKVATEEIADPAGATERAFGGSPTILLDGIDPFASPQGPSGFACRTYRTEIGVEGAPSVDQLLRALSAQQRVMVGDRGLCTKAPGSRPDQLPAR